MIKTRFIKSQQMENPMFSATGKILCGTELRPDIYTLIDPTSENSTGETQVSRKNALGYLPGVSTITGLGKILLGIIHAIVHLVCAIFDKKNRSKHLAEAKLGSVNILRGLGELAPVAGNIGVAIYDGTRIKKQLQIVERFLEENRVLCWSNLFLFANNRLVAQKTVPEIKLLAQQAKFTSRPNYWDIVDLLQKS